MPGRSRHQGQDFAGGRLDGHDGAHLAGHQLLSVLLELRVDGGDDVLARNGFLVHGPVLVRLLNLVPGVAEVDMIPFFAPQVLLPGRLYSGHAGIVAATVLAGVLLHVALVHLRDISEEVAAGVHRVFAHAAHLPAKAGELVFHFVKAHVGFGRKHAQHGHGLEADGCAFPLVFGQFAPDEFRRDVQGGGERQGVEGPYVARDHQNVVRHFISHQDGAVPVEDGTAGGIDGLIDGGIAVGVLLVAVVRNLDGKKGAQQQQNSRSQANEQADMTSVSAHRC